MSSSRVKYIYLEPLILQVIPVVNEFPDVFLEDLFNLPPKWEVEFGINVIPSTQQIFIPPYRISPSEMRVERVTKGLARKKIHKS